MGRRRKVGRYGSLEKTFSVSDTCTLYNEGPLGELARAGGCVGGQCLGSLGNLVLKGEIWKCQIDARFYGKAFPFFR